MCAVVVHNFTFFAFRNSDLYTMKRSLTFTLAIACLSTLLTLPARGQYYPGMNRPGMGMGGGIPQASGPARPIIPNIAGGNRQ